MNNHIQTLVQRYRQLDSCKEDILKAYSNSDIVQICRYLNKDYNIYDPEVVRWKKIRYAFSKTPAKDLID